MSLRTERIAEQLRAEIARVLREESSDPRIGLVTLTHVDVAPDLSQALVFWSPLEAGTERDLDEMADGLESASGFIRGRLAQALQLRRMPVLQFRHDGSLETGSRTLSILRALEDERGDRDDGETEGQNGE